MARSLNKVQLIGNLTRDPELKYTPNGSAVCTFGMATNRSWKTDTGELKEEADFHKIVVWGKLAEICAQILKKGRKAYVEGRLQTRSWAGTDGVQKYTTEVVVSDMMALDSKGSESSAQAEDHLGDIPADFGESEVVQETAKPAKKTVKKEESKTKESADDASDDMPF